MRAKIHIEDGGGSSAAGGAKRRPKRPGASSSKPLVVITELPYQTNKVRGRSSQAQLWLMSAASDRRCADLVP